MRHSPSTRCTIAKTVPKDLPIPSTKFDLEGFFKLQDVNGDGKLDSEELKKAFKKLGAHFPGARANRAIYYGDNNGDQLINIEDELNDVVNYALEKGYTIISV